MRTRNILAKTLYFSMKIEQKKPVGGINLVHT